MMASLRAFFKKLFHRIGKGVRSFRLTRAMVLRGVLFLVISVVAGTAVFRWNSQALVGDSLPMPFGFGFAVVLSGSMEPEFSEGDLLLVVKQEEYRENEVVVFQDGRSLVSHRIISVNDGEFITQGTANNSPDPPIVKEQIKGKVLLPIPYLGVLVDVIKSPLGTVCILVMAFLLLRLSSRAERKREAQAEEEAAILRKEIAGLKQENEKE